MMIMPFFTAALSLFASAASDPPHVVTVRAYDFRFEAPMTIPAGTTTFRLVNRGKEIHHLWIVQLAKGKTPDQFMEVAKKWGSALKMPSWAVDVGGPNSAAANEGAEGTMTLDPGTYMLLCWIPSPDGMLHVMKGMVRSMTVTATGASKPEEPKADVRITMNDYSFDLSEPIKAGHRTIQFENTAAQSHEAVIARLEPNHTIADAVRWMNGGQLGPSPVEPIGGASGLARGRHMFITADFEPGKYVLLCFIPDVKDGKPHSDHGMVKEIVVNP
jgi:uncharacterized cupredoxin-like copper-binding protein